MSSLIFLNAPLERIWPQCEANGDFNVHDRKTTAGRLKKADFELLICVWHVGKTDRGQEISEEIFLSLNTPKNQRKHL